MSKKMITPPKALRQMKLNKPKSWMRGLGSAWDENLGKRGLGNWMGDRLGGDRTWQKLTPWNDKWLRGLMDLEPWEPFDMPPHGETTWGGLGSTGNQEWSEHPWIGGAEENQPGPNPKGHRSQKQFIESAGHGY